VKPATTVTKVVPVNYEREIMTVVQPATEKRIPVPAEYAEREVTKLVAAAKEVRVPIPAEYADVPQEVLVCPVQEYWTSVALRREHHARQGHRNPESPGGRRFQPGRQNGDLNEATMKAVADFQKAKGLPQDGFLNMETVKALGVSPK
jgi:peptidoglycan hydrolase-like protein with peptidoglycan-binding domain